MRPVALGIPGRDLAASDAVSLERKRSFQRSLDEEYFQREMKAGTPIYYGGVTEAFNVFTPVMRFPDGAASGAVQVEAARKLWVGTRPRVNVWYTSPVGSTATFNFFMGMTFYGVTGTTTAPAINVAWTAPGPAIAGTVLFTTAVLAGRVLSSPFGTIAMELDRNQAANDANAQVLDVLLAQIVFEEVA